MTTLDPFVIDAEAARRARLWGEILRGALALVATVAVVALLWAIEP